MYQISFDEGTYEGCSGGCFDVLIAPVAFCARNCAANGQPNEDSCRLHNRRAQLLNKNDGHKDRESEADELWVTPWKRF